MSLRPLRECLLCGGALLGTAFVSALPAHCQTFRFELRAEPDVIPANGLSTTSIFVQLPPNVGGIAPSSVRFATTLGSIESQAMLSGGVARVLLRSANTPGTATITAFIGNAREETTVEFAEDTGLRERFLEVDAPYVAYGQGNNLITASGTTTMDFGDLHIESDVRLDVDLATERVWAQGTPGQVRIRYGRGAKAAELRGDRLFYDLRRRQGVMRRSNGDASDGPTGARQEFTGIKFSALPPLGPGETSSSAASASAAPLSLLPAGQAPTSAPVARQELSATTATATAPSPPKPAATPSLSSLMTAAPPIEENPPAPTSDTTQANEPLQENPSVAVSASTPSTSTVPSAVAPSAVAPGSLAASPAPLAAGTKESTRPNPLVAEPKNEGSSAPSLQTKLPAYSPLGEKEGPAPRVVELPPPGFDATSGYWVTARRLRVFPRDKIQFERAKIYFNGGKAFSLPLYVLPLDGSFDPTTDLVAFNSRGVGINFPVPYQASAHGTGTLWLRNGVGGFSSVGGGPSAKLQQQYWLSSSSHGQFSVENIGQNTINFLLSHEQQLSSRTVADFYLSSPRFRDMYSSATLRHDLGHSQIGFEGFYDKPQGQVGQARGQFFWRMQPKKVATTGWTYSMSANLLAVDRVPFRDTSLGGSIGVGGGGIGLPGSGLDSTAALTRYRTLFGQTVGASLSSPTYAPWRGASFSANVLATAFNYSDGRRGFAPGLNLAMTQALGQRANLSLSYTYDRSSLGLYGATSASFTNYFTANLNAAVTRKINVSAFASRSLSDDSLYANAGVDYMFAPKWRVGAFLDYANFASGSTSSLNTGWSLGRTVGNRELSLNYDRFRKKVYLQYGSLSTLF